MSNHELIRQAKKKALAGVTVGLCGFALIMMRGGVVHAATTTDGSQQTTTAQVVNNNSTAATPANQMAVSNNQTTNNASGSTTTNAPASSAAANTSAGSTSGASSAATMTAYTRAAYSPAANHTATNLPQGQEYGHIDNASYANGKLHVIGWNALDWPANSVNSNNLHHYLIVYDKTANRQLASKDITYDAVARPDVPKVYPNLYNGGNSGFSEDFDIDSSAWLNDVLAIVSRYSTYDGGNGDDGNANHKADWWSEGFYANRNNFGWLDQATFTGNTLTVSGWHATNNSYTQPNRYVIIWDQTQGKQLASVKLTPSQEPTRTDVGNIYSGVYNSNKSGFNVTFNTSSFNGSYLGDTVQVVDRYSDSASGNGGTGHYTDYWTSPFRLTVENRYSFDSVNMNNGTLNVTGWHATSLDGSLPYQFIILHDDTTNRDVAFQNVSQGQPGYVNRPDVANVYPNLPGNAQSGFNTSLTNVSNLVYGHHYTIISRRAANSANDGASGNHLDVSYAFNYNQHAYYIDYINPKSTNGLTIRGWMASDVSNQTPYAYVIVLGNGREIGRQRVTLTSRPDVARAYPMIANADRSGFSVNFGNINPSQYSTLQVVLRYTADPAGNIAGYTYDDVANVTYQNATGNVHLARGAYGVDVSSYQGTDMSNYARNGAQFAIIKTTEGTGYVNPRAAGQIASAKANNMVVMAYHFAHFNGSVAEARAEANYFLRNSASLPKGSIMVLDDESYFSGSQSANTQAAIAFMQVVKNAGYVPYFYTSSSMGRNQVNIYTIENAFPNSYWVAAYPNGNGASWSADFDYFPSNPGVAMWQFTDNWKGMGVDASILTLPIDLTLA